MTSSPSPARGGSACRRIGVAVALALVLSGVLGASPADARTDDRSKPVLFVHGYNPTSSSTDCGGDFDAMISQLRSQGFTGPMVKVGFYSGDVNCDVNLRSVGGFSDSSSWKLIAKAFSKHIWNTYTSRGSPSTSSATRWAGSSAEARCGVRRRRRAGSRPRSTSRT